MNPREIQVIRALKKGCSVQEACQQASITEETFFRYLERGEFKKELDRYTKGRSVQFELDLIQSKFKAQSILLKIIDNKDTTTQDKIEATRLML